MNRFVRTASVGAFVLGSQLFTFSAIASGGQAPGTGPDTNFQKACRQEALEKGPMPVIFAFDGLNAYDQKDYFDLKSRTTPPSYDEPGPSGTGHLLWGMIAHGALQVPGPKNWYYFDQSAVDGESATDAYRCAFEWATARYSVQQPDGTSVIERNKIVIFGFSYGGHAASQLSNQLDQAGLDVDLIITADPRTKGWVGSLEKKPSTHLWLNFYQTNTPFLNGYQVEGVDFESNLTSRGYGHTDMPRSKEVREYVQQEFAKLY